MAGGAVVAPAWGEVEEAIGAPDPALVVARLRAILDGGCNFRVARDALRRLAPGGRERAVLLEALPLALPGEGGGGGGGAQVAFLVLDAASGGDGGADPPGADAAARAAAAGALLRCLAPERARIAARLATAYGLGPGDVDAAGGPGARARVAAFAAALVEARALSPAAALLGQFPFARDAVPPPAFFRAAVAANQTDAGRLLADALPGRDAEAQLVDACLAGGLLRHALQAVRDYGLHDRYPTIEDDYREHVVERLLGEGLLTMAAAVAGRGADAPHRRLQERVVREMVASGELALASEYREAFGLGDALPPLDEASVAAEAAARAGRYLALDLPDAAVVWVGDGEALRRAGAALDAHEGPLGLDVEWRPDIMEHRLGPAGGGGPRAAGGDAAEAAAEAALAGAGGAGGGGAASVLQLGTGAQCFLFDLLALAGDGRLSAALGCLSRPGVRVVGFDVAGDLRKLRQSYPGEPAFAHVPRLLDLKDLYPAYRALPGAGAPPAPGGPRGRGQFGLSAVTEDVLGRPLDKACQLSDWNRRPLSERQARYAALDAHVLVRVLARMRETEGLGALADSLTRDWRAGGGGGRGGKRRAAGGAPGPRGARAPGGAG